MTAPALGPYPLVACKFCAEQIAANSIGRHQKQCESATPEERAKRAYARADGRRRMRAANVPVVTPAPEPERRSHHRSKQRDYQREYQRRYAERRKANDGHPLRELAAATAHARAMLSEPIHARKHSLNGKGDDLVELTIALPRSVVMDMLIQGLPHATIVSIGGWRLEQ